MAVKRMTVFTTALGRAVGREDTAEKRTASELYTDLGRKVLEISCPLERLPTRWGGRCRVSVLGTGWFGFHYRHLTSSGLTLAAVVGSLLLCPLAQVG
jgi:hypothetical protein